MWSGDSSATSSTGEEGLRGGQWQEGLPMLKIIGQTLCRGSPTAGCPSWLPEVSLHPQEDGCFLHNSGLRAAWVFGSPHQLSLP